MSTVYTVFRRSATGWDSFANARKTVIHRGLNREEARAMCEAYNVSRTRDQIRKGMKYEFTAE